MPCEICKLRVVDVHHISPRQMGGSKTKDYIENLIGLCRACHELAENESLTENYLYKIHLIFIKQEKPDYESAIFTELYNLLFKES